MIDQSTVEKIFAASRIEEVVADYVQLKRRGVNYIGCCPFHNEKTPSFTVSPAKGICKCFGCGKGGNAVNFLMELEQISYYEALKQLAKKYHIEVIETERSPEQMQQQTDRESMMVVTEFAQQHFASVMLSTQEGQSVGLGYFRERGFRDDIVQKFGLGYCRDIRDGFTKAALEKGFKLEYLEKTGLSIVKEGYNADRFRARVIFPIHSVSGKAIAFGGRTLSSDKKVAKYVNSPESEIYSKSSSLYGIFQAKNSILKEDKCILVEGYTDVLSLHQAGVENAVASSGTSLTENQIKLIKRFTPNVTVIYDGDQAGIKASFRGIDMLLSQGLNVRVVLLPEGEDPDSFSKGKPSEEVKKMLAETETDFMRFKTQVLISESGGDPIQKASAINDIIQSLSVIPDTVARSVYIEELSLLMQISKQVLEDALKGKISSAQPAKKTAQQKPRQAALPKPPKISATEAHEREICRLLVMYADTEINRYFADGHEIIITVKDYICNEIIDGGMMLVNPELQKIIDSYLSFAADGQTAAVTKMVQSPDSQISGFMATVFAADDKQRLHRIWTKNENLVLEEAAVLHELLPDVINSYKEKRISAEIEDLLTKLKAQIPEDEGLELLNRLHQLNKFKTLIAKSLKNRAIN
jgi:DNA primase